MWERHFPEGYFPWRGNFPGGILLGGIFHGVSFSGGQAVGGGPTLATFSVDIIVALNGKRYDFPRTNQHHTKN